MAHAIIFVDRAPRTREHDYTSQYYTHSAGAYKIASVLREMGLTVVVVPNCLNLTLAGVKSIVEKNSKNLLWVGLSTTFFSIEVDTDILLDYRRRWATSDDFFIDVDPLYQKWHSNLQNRSTLVWGLKEVGRISHYLETQHNAAFLIGGAHTDLLIGHQIQHRNTQLILGYAEKYVKDFTQARLTDPKAGPPLFANNNEYDDNDFKNSKIIWQKEDMVEPDDWLPLEIARGCAFDCAYCNYPRKSSFDAFKRPEVLYDEIMRNYELWGVTRYLVVDDLYNDSKEKVRILYDKVWSRLPFRPEWISYMRLDMIWNDPDSADFIKNSGCRYASFGIETLNDIAGRRVGKGLGKKRIIETLEMLKEKWQQETLVNGLLIAGLPFEPLKSIQETMEWSVTTDLLHSPSWNPMMLAPPDTKSWKEKNKIDSDFEKYGVTWIGPQDWVNSEGVTKQMVDKLVTGYVERVSSWKFRFALGTYIDVRNLGFTHYEIANWKVLNLSDQEINIRNQKIKDKIMTRLGKIMALKM